MNFSEKKYLLTKFPKNIELFYEKPFHNKVYKTDYYITIPKGKKYFAWFKTFNEQNYLFILEIDRRKSSIKSFDLVRVCFDNSLCFRKGTIFYGTIFLYNKHKFFNIEDVLYFKSQDVSDYSNVKKFSLLDDIFKKYLKQNCYFDELVFGLPNIITKRTDIDRVIRSIPYPLYAIQHRMLHNKMNSVINENITRFNMFANFLLKAEICPDTYNIMAMKNNKYVSHGFALINSYKQSVYMNNIFRTIKENINLDYLEESDDEEEFENIDINKFIKINKEVVFRCVYNRKYKLWSPIEMVKENVSSMDEIINIEK
jgi:hypothetical protein